MDVVGKIPVASTPEPLHMQNDFHFRRRTFLTAVKMSAGVNPAFCACFRASETKWSNSGRGSNGFKDDHVVFPNHDKSRAAFQLQMILCAQFAASCLRSPIVEVAKASAVSSDVRAAKAPQRRGLIVARLSVSDKC